MNSQMAAENFRKAVIELQIQSEMEGKDVIKEAEEAACKIVNSSFTEEECKINIRRYRDSKAAGENWHKSTVVYWLANYKASKKFELRDN